jgi:hypothetical protein
MPVTDPNMPQPLREAMNSMEATVQSFKTDISYQAPEMHRELWIELQLNLVDTLKTLYNEVSATPYEPS